MGVDQTSLDRIRNATFPSARRGYEKREVEKFLARLADWLETGGGDESRSDTVKRELERVGQRTGAILSQAEESAEQIRAEAEEEARASVAEASATAEKTRSEVNSYAGETRSAADAYAGETRKKADQEAGETRAEAEQEARETITAAQEKARRIVEEGTRRRQDIEAVIADLVSRRDDVLGDTETLTEKLTRAVHEHRPAGEDPFAVPEELDPLDGVAAEDEPFEAEDDADAEADADGEAEEIVDEGAEDAEPTEVAQDTAEQALPEDEEAGERSSRKSRRRLRQAKA
jgi:DivIVA domain-containing protein